MSRNNNLVIKLNCNIVFFWIGFILWLTSMLNSLLEVRIFNADFGLYLSAIFFLAISNFGIPIKLKKNAILFSWVGGYMLLLLIATVKSFYVSYSLTIIENVILYLSYLMLTFFSVRFISYYMYFDKVNRLSIFLLGGFESFILLTKIDIKVDVLWMIANLFNHHRMRDFCGLNHPNEVGVLSFTVAVLCLVDIFTMNRNILLKIFELLFILNSGLLVLLAASRAGITSVLCMLVVFFSLCVYSRNNKKVRILIIILVILLLFSLAWTIDFEFLFINSNRAENFLINIPILLKSKNYFWGMGIVPGGVFASRKLGVHTTNVDNYYLYVFLTSGVVGICMLFPQIIRITKELINKANEGSIQSKAILAMFVSLLYYSLFENVFFYPNMISTLVWILSVSSLNGSQRFKNYETKRESSNNSYSASI